MATLKEEKNKKSKKSNIEKIEMLELFKQMYLIRQFELACGENYTKGNMMAIMDVKKNEVSSYGIIQPGKFDKNIFEIKTHINLVK